MGCLALLSDPFTWIRVCSNNDGHQLWTDVVDLSQMWKRRMFGGTERKKRWLWISLLWETEDAKNKIGNVYTLILSPLYSAHYICSTLWLHCCTC